MTILDGNDHHDDGPSSSFSSKLQLSSLLISFISGGVGGACSVLIGHPFDLIKVRIQTSSICTTTTTKNGGSITEMLCQTIRSEGVRGLFRGVSAPLVTVVPVTALSFWGYDIGQQLVHWYKNSEDQNDGQFPTPATALSTVEIGIAGAVAAIPATFIIAPTERIKCLLQVQQHHQHHHPQKKQYYKGSLDCTKQVLKEGGIKSLYKGTIMTLVRGIPGTMAYFAMYEYSKREIILLQNNTNFNDNNINPTSSSEQELSLVAIIIAGGLAGMAYWSIGIPIIADVLKSRYQTAPLGTYTGYKHVYQTLIAEKPAGYTGLFKGYKPAIVRAIPASMARSLGMELTRKVLEIV
jgi:solute carrier family 25 carnitine/acylcarnitine transporter 20/29